MGSTLVRAAAVVATVAALAVGADLPLLVLDEVAIKSPGVTGRDGLWTARAVPAL
jgi:hypothetical protein